MSEARDRAQAGARLGADLRTIREDAGVDLASLMARTKTAPDIVEAFESTGLANHPVYNRVYLRSFARSYAQVVGIDEDRILNAVDEMLAGRYAGSLLAGDAGAGDPTEDAASEKERDAGESIGKTQKPDEESASTDEEVGSGGAVQPPVAADAGHGQETEPSAADKDQADTDAEALEAAPAAGVATPASGSEEHEQDAESGVDEPSAEGEAPAGRALTVRGTSGITPPATVPSRAAPSATLLTPQLVRRIAVWTFAVLALAAIIWVGLSMREPEGPTAPPPDPVPVDTVKAAPGPMPIVLPESLDVRIIAARDTLNPIRVTPDTGVRRPYWVEIGDTLTFRVREQIMIERYLDALDVDVLGYRLRTDDRDEQGRVTIGRSDVQAQIDSLRGVGPPGP